MLKNISETNTKVELFIDINMYLMIEKEIKGGICNIIQRYSKTTENKHILYIDTNNLYE